MRDVGKETKGMEGENGENVKTEEKEEKVGVRCGKKGR